MPWLYLEAGIALLLNTVEFLDELQSTEKTQARPLCRFYYLLLQIAAVASKPTASPVACRELSFGGVGTKWGYLAGGTSRILPISG
jgi:hypothetical protein